MNDTIGVQKVNSDEHLPHYVLYFRQLQMVREAFQVGVQIELNIFEY